MNSATSGARRLTMLVAVLALGALFVSGCGGSDSNSVHTNIEKSLNKQVEAGTKLAEEGNAKAKEGAEEAKAQAKRGIEEGKVQAKKAQEEAKKLIEEATE